MSNIKQIIFLLIFGMLFCFNGFSQADSLVQLSKPKMSKVAINLLPKISLFNKKEKAQYSERTKNKLVALALGIALGPFGVHRLYLGTKPKVPIAYTCTLGGGFFILPLIDIFYIILNQNPDYIENNDNVFIWNKKKRLEK